ncbi:hypothetical protein D3C73_535630 [compost metagenome]
MQLLNNWKKRGALCSLALALILPSSIHAESSVSYTSNNVTYNGKSFSVKWVVVDLLDPYLRVRPVIAEEGFGHVEAFSTMMERNSAIAGINGAFFSAYEQDDSIRYPNGLMIKSGEIMHSGPNQAFEILADKTAAVQHIETELQIKASHNGKTYSFTPWGVNKYYGDNQTDQVIWYTPDFGRRIEFPNSTKIVIRDGIIDAITQQSVSIPEDGYIALIGNSNNNSRNLLPNLHVGDSITTVSSLKNLDSGDTSSLPKVDAAIGAGPRLLTEGAVDIDVTRDGFTDPKITKQSNVRSFIGIDTSKRLVMGNISSSTLTEMAQVLLKLGLTDAMNLDGGASTGLFANGSVVTYPGRLLSNAFIVERMEHPQIQLEVNKQWVHEFRGYLYKETSMVPVRGILERIGANFKWNGEERTLTVQHGNHRLLLRADSRTAELNQTKLQLPEAPSIIDGHIYLPLRSVIEALGGQVEWDPQLYRAKLTIP